jgi:hypothetical protein
MFNDTTCFSHLSLAEHDSYATKCSSRHFHLVLPFTIGAQIASTFPGAGYQAQTSESFEILHLKTLEIKNC